MTHNRLTSYVTYTLFMKHPIWAFMFMSLALVSTNCYSMVALFSAMVEKCSYTLNFCFLFFFKSSNGVRHFSIGSILPSSFKTLSKSTWDYAYNFFSFIGRNAHMFHHISTSMPSIIQYIIERTFMMIITYVKFHLQSYHPCFVCKLH